MKMKAVIYLFFKTVLLLASANVAFANSSAKTQGNTKAQSKTKVSTPASQPAPSSFGMMASISRSTSMVDFEDGTRSDSMDYLFRPSGRFSTGTLSLSIGYTQDLRDDSETASDWSDASLTWAFKPIPFGSTQPSSRKTQNARINYSVSALIPVSKNSRIRDQLQGALSGAVGFSVTPIDNGFSYGARVTAGRNFHPYSENINGSVLNQYSSNQGVNVGYTYGNWDLSVSFTNMTRWTYQGNTRSVFDLSEELSYAVNQSFSLAVGHTNSGSNLRPNGMDSNISLFNENSSIIYGTLSATY